MFQNNDVILMLHVYTSKREVSRIFEKLMVKVSMGFL